MASLVDSAAPATTLLAPDWCDWALRLIDGADDPARLARIEAFLLPRWQALALQRPPAQRYLQWVQGLAARAATSAAGRSRRQVERRVKAWAGLPMRALRAVSRAEQAFLAAAPGQAGQRGTGASWADIAAQADYADQSQLCRESRRLTGFSPQDLRRRMQTEHAFWPYRLWR